MERTSVIRVLIVDDSAIVRKILSESLAAEADIEVVGTAPDPFVAAKKIEALSPHVLTLDIEMPGMDGLTFLKKLMHHRPMPVIVVSSLAQRSCATALEAMRLGAVDVVAKPGGPFSVGDLRSSLASKVRAAAGARVSAESPKIRKTLTTVPSFPDRRLIAIGASTGGTEAIRIVLEDMPANSPGIVIAQHIPPGFSAAFADRLAKICKVRVREARDGDQVETGLALIAPGDRHMIVKKCASGYRISIENGPKVCYQRPSVDVLFNSVAESAAERVTAALLTGMGADGARGLLQIRKNHGATIAQDEASCVVFGMPKEAIRLDAAQQVLPLSEISQSLLNASARTLPPRNKEHIEGAKGVQHSDCR
jgi:two-component system chemotaxis response regulator CheB